jgi:Leucine-rich repeat (LRR) protein
LAQLQSLRHLDLSGCTFAENAPAFSAGRLRSLRLARTNANDATISELLKLKELRCLDLSITRITDAAVAALTDLGQLEALGVGFTSVGDHGFRAISKLSKLRDLDVSRSQISDSTLDLLKTNTALERIEMFSTNVTDRGAAALRHLRGLRRVGIGHTEVTDEGLAGLRFLPDLEDLDLGFLNPKSVTNAAIVPFVMSNSLHHLRLERGFGDLGMLYVAEIKSLEALNLQFTITDEGLKQLSSLPKLRRVTISQGDQVSDAAIEQLKRRIRGLEVRVSRSRSFRSITTTGQ